MLTLPRVRGSSQQLTPLKNQTADGLYYAVRFWRCITSTMFCWRKKYRDHGNAERLPDEGKLIAPIEFLVTGDLSSCMAVFHARALPGVMLKPDRSAIQP
ncbi:hypothetical protein B9P84_20025 [Citrobacter braakii]|nr:hypothetical protein [Citrobacter braakii]MDL4386247.1 hypothetical protein [Citrobacter braakii]OXU10058.1 hypothetical protein B9P84_20025 [Citrobacter braakii]